MKTLVNLVKNSGIPSNMGLDHVGIVVPNAREAADFLIEVFDAVFDWEVKREPSPKAGERGWSDIFGVHSESYLSHVIMLKCGEQALTQYVELFEWVSPDQYKPKDGWHKFSDVGNSYLSFTVKDIDAVLSHLKNEVIPKWKGTRLIQDPPMQFPLRGEICTSTFLVSPWGMWIEITCWSKSKDKGHVINATSVTEQSIVGKHIDELSTPSFLVDLDIVDHNIQLMRERIVNRGFHWRLPCKGHRCPELAKYILSNGAAEGVVLLTLNEVAQFAAAHIDDIYFANQVYTQQDIERLVLLAKQVKRLRISIDNADYLHAVVNEIKRWEIITPIEVLIELNVNHHRNGVSTIDEAVQLATLVVQIEKQTGAIIFAGITGYEGHTPVLSDVEKAQATHISHKILANAKAAIEQRGIRVSVVSGGGSCNYMDCLNTNTLTEIQAGGAVIGDVLYCEKANLKHYGHKMGASVLTQITSVPLDQSRAIGDAGFKKIGWHPFAGLPMLRDCDDLIVSGLSAEHVRLKAKNHSAAIARGDKIVLIPGYLDAMGFLHKELYAIRNDQVEAVWKLIE